MKHRYIKSKYLTRNYRDKDKNIKFRYRGDTFGFKQISGAAYYFKGYEKGTSYLWLLKRVVALEEGNILYVRTRKNQTTQDHIFFLKDHLQQKVLKAIF